MNNKRGEKKNNLNVFKSKQFLNQLIMPTIILSFVALFLIQARGISQPSENMRLPYISIGIILITMAIALFKEYKNAVIKSPEASEKNKSWFYKNEIRQRQLFVIIAVLIYVFMMEKIGFIVSTVIFIPTVLYLFKLGNLKVSLSLSVIGSVSLFVLFRNYLYILLPESVLEETILTLLSKL